MGAGTSFNTIDFFLTSNEGIFIFTPEPTSVENTIRFIKAIYYRRLKQVLKQRPFSAILKMYIDKSNDPTIRLPNIIKFVIEQDPDKGKLLRSKLSEYKFRFILNEFRKQINPRLGENIEKVYRHFYSKFQFLGNVSYDERVHNSIFSKRIYMKKYPYTPTAIELQHIARKITENSQDSTAMALQLS